MLNKPQYVAIASNKLSTLQALQTVGFAYLPEWTTNQEEAKKMLETPKFEKKKNAVVCRTLLSANSGRGITLAGTVEEIIPAPLYTRYVPKACEYRVHVLGGAIADIQQKRRPTGVEISNSYIRNHANGWIFCPIRFRYIDFLLKNRPMRGAFVCFLSSRTAFRSRLVLLRCAPPFAKRSV